MEKTSTNQGLLVVVSGPAGVGKGTIVKEYLKKYNDLKLSISTTTRNPREGEKDGVEYYFKTKEEFLKMIKEDKLLEYVKVFDNYYGTSKDFIETQLNKGNNLLLEIEIIGAMNVKKIYKNAVLIFIMPPSFEILKKRIINRGQDSQEQIEKRLERMKKEIQEMKNYDYFIVNNTIEDSVEAMRNIIVSSKHNAKIYGKDVISSYFEKSK